MSIDIRCLDNMVCGAELRIEVLDERNANVKEFDPDLWICPLCGADAVEINR